MKLLHLLLLAAALASSLRAETPKSGPPYPTAGGAGGRIITVTNLNESGPGSLKEAFDTNEPRIIRFAVAGEIWLKKGPLQLGKSFVTVEGESAPSPGITIIGDKLRIRTHDAIVRHLRVRVGDLVTASDAQNRDGISVDGATDGSDPGYNVLVENCSVSWAVDESCQLWGPNNHDIVIRNCILGEALAKSIHPKGGHSAGLIVGPGIRNVLIQGNLFAHNSFRNPVVSAGSSAVVLNNLIYNPGFGIIHVYGRAVNPETGQLNSPKDVVTWKDNDPKAALQVSVIGNSVIAGASTSKKPGMFHKLGLNGGSAIYLHDNLAPGLDSAFDQNSRPPGWDVPGAPSPFVSAPPAGATIPAGIEPLPAAEVEAFVLAKVGARPKDRDAVDQRILEEVKTRTGKIKDHPLDARLNSPPAPVVAAIPIPPTFAKNAPAKNALAAWLQIKSESEEPIGFEVIGVSEGAGLVKYSEKGATLSRALTPDKWDSASITFKFTQDTDVLLRFSAAFASPNRMWVYIDDIKAPGIELKNSDLEDGNGETPEGWQFRQGPVGKATRLSDAGFAASGKRYVKVAQSSALAQIVKVPANKEITVSFSARGILMQ